jgi:hypothetical protein
MGREQDQLRLARLFYSAAAVIALIVAVGAAAPAVTGVPGGCHVVLSVGAPAVPGSSGGPVPQASPGPAVPGAPADCAQYVDVGLPLVVLLFGAIFVLTTIRLGRDPRTWGRAVAIGAITGIVAAFRASLAIAGIAASDQQQSVPGAGVLIIDALLVLVALASAFVVLQALDRGRDAPPGSGGLV